MSDVIYISSSEDEEDYFKKQLSSNLSLNQKRKLSVTSSDDEYRIKRNKVGDESEVSNDSSPNKAVNDNSEYEFPDSMPGPSKPCNSETSILSDISYNSDPVKKVIKPQLVVGKKISIPESVDNVFMNFLEACEHKKPCIDTSKILSKLKKEFEKLNYINKDDKDFQYFLGICLNKICNDPTDKFYGHIQELHDEIKRRIKVQKVSMSSDSGAKQQSIKELKDNQEIELSKEDMKKVRLLEKNIKKCKNRIQELEEEEVDFDEDDNSVYLKADRYKRKLVELCKVLSEIVRDRMLKKEIYKKKIRRKDIPDEMTEIPCLDEAIIDFVNCNINQLNKLKHINNPNTVADYLTMPDYMDILNCIMQCNEQKTLELTETKMKQLANVAFKSIGSYLQKRRIRENEEQISSYIEDVEASDPAIKDSDLYKRLQENRKDGDKKLEQIFQKYVNEQEELSPEKLVQLNLQESASEGESSNEASKKNEESNSKNYIKNEIYNMIINSDDERNESDVNIKTKEF